MSGTLAAIRSTWAIPQAVLGVATRAGLLLLAPMVAALVLVGPTATLGIAMGYVAVLAPAIVLPTRHALALSAPGVMAGVVAVSVNGEALPAACLVALSSLLVAPANMYSNGLLAGIPTVAAVFATAPARLEPGFVAGWMLLGSVLGVVIVGRLRPSSGPPGDLVGVDARTAWSHAAAMAVVVGLVVLVVTLAEVPHGDWIALTTTIVLRPYGQETRSVAGQRVVGTLGGALAAVLLAALAPAWLGVLVSALLLILVIGYTLLERYALSVAAATPLAVLAGAGSSADPVWEVGLARVAATVVGALMAGAVALALARADRNRMSDGPDQAGAEPDPAHP